MTDHATTADRLVAISRCIDAGNAHRDPEAITWGRLAKLSEETGEVIAAFIGATGQNPRKGVTHDHVDVLAELLDVAVTALGAYEHLDGHMGNALPALNMKIRVVANRLLGLAPTATAGPAVAEQRRIDDTPCPTCGGDRLRPDFSKPGPPCHATPTTPNQEQSS